jgi:cysteine synthase A
MPSIISLFNGSGAEQRNPQELDMHQEAEDFFRSAISDPEQPLVMFAVEWCEFCWAVRRLFATIAVPYRAIDLDTGEFLENDHGKNIRAVLKAHTGSPTIPQIFIDGKYIGGATATFDAYKQGTLQTLLRQAGLDFKDIPGLDPYHLKSV